MTEIVCASVKRIEHKADTKATNSQHHPHEHDEFSEVPWLLPKCLGTKSEYRKRTCHEHDRKQGSSDSSHYLACIPTGDYFRQDSHTATSALHGKTYGGIFEGSSSYDTN